MGQSPDRGSDRIAVIGTCPIFKALGCGCNDREGTLETHKKKNEQDTMSSICSHHIYIYILDSHMRLTAQGESYEAQLEEAQ